MAHSRLLLEIIILKLVGIHWLRLSRFTMKAAEGFNRYTLFDRNPWDPQYAKFSQRYSDYYARGSVQQDVRWGNKAFQGFALDGGELPYDLILHFCMVKQSQVAAQLNRIDNNTYQQSHTVFKHSILFFTSTFLHSWWTLNKNIR